MADEDGGLTELHPEDRRKITSDVLTGILPELRALFEATAKGPASAPPARPPLDADSFDERQFKRLKDDLVVDFRSLVREATSRFVPDEEINSRLEERFSEIQDALDRFKSEILKDVRQVVHDEFEKERAGWLESCRKIIRDETERIFTLIGLRIDNPDKIEDTRKVIEEMKRLLSTAGEFKKEAFGQVIKAFGLWIGGLVTLALGYLGLKGSGH